MECSNCKAINIDGARFCSKCGTAIITEVICPNCNTINLPGSKFCKNCGNRFALPDAETIKPAETATESPEPKPKDETHLENLDKIQKTPNADISEKINSVKLIIENNLSFNDSGFYFHENIPSKKKDSALQSYVFLEGDEEIICLHDSTVFGGAKEGVCLTNYGIFWKDIMEKGNRLMYSAIKKIEIKNKFLVLNDLKIEACASVTELKKTLEEIVNMVKENAVSEESPGKHNPLSNNKHEKDDDMEKKFIGGDDN